LKCKLKYNYYSKYSRIYTANNKWKSCSYKNNPVYKRSNIISKKFTRKHYNRV